jgi:hypothetical protein
MAAGHPRVAGRSSSRSPPALSDLSADDLEALQRILTTTIAAKDKPGDATV